ncbi:MAG: phosphoribosylglycinamide formyltransferase [Bacteroidota bacterium]
MKQIAIFASGEGTNAQRLIDYFKNSCITINMIACNNSQAGVLNRAARTNTHLLLFNHKQFYYSDVILQKLLSEKINLIVLAGFMWKVPENILSAFPDKIINIHPALLPKYGGKGMYGMNVHNAVIAAKEKESGITIHYVNEKYDEGKIIFQKKCEVSTDDTPESLSTKVHAMEYEYYPKIIEQLL